MFVSRKENKKKSESSSPHHKLGKRFSIISFTVLSIISIISLYVYCNMHELSSHFIEFLSINN
jgi:hypothetical protein